MFAFLSFPDAPLTESLVRDALNNITDDIVFLKTPSEQKCLLQYGTYDKLDHEATHAHAGVLASSYTIRKALIRKHYLHRTIVGYLAKHPSSILASAVPRTWDIDISWADELDDLFTDELWDLADMMQSSPKRWFILKAGMADGGNGIRLFNSRESLYAIFEEFDEESEAGSASDAPDIITSQLRHFVIQEYLDNPLLVDPSQTALSPSTSPERLRPYKFHLRAYCLASGALTVYLWSHILALFAGVPYSTPKMDEHGRIPLLAHLTNTALLTAEHGESGIRLLSELAGHFISQCSPDSIFTESDVSDIVDQMADILAETFRAALGSPVHFQPLPNAFELFGVDFLVTHAPEGFSGKSRFRVSLLEINSEPAIERTGQRLQWILRDMFKSIGRVSVGPFFNQNGDLLNDWEVGETREGFRKCLQENIR
ncbi:tubulin-tyrosine ligase [Hysterangium stoloniferum]|nr:tubulin-tyrosine ligase [Hysterangium stoloniferum]